MNIEILINNIFLIIRFKKLSREFKIQNIRRFDKKKSINHLTNYINMCKNF